MSQGWSEILRADRPADVTRAAEILRDGGIVALPTETVYGLAGNALDAASVARIYRAKGRPSDNPLIVHVTGFDALVGLCSQVPDAAQQLASAFWPGPLTMVLPKLPCVPDAVTGGGGTVGVRAPDHPAFQAVLREAGIPLAAPSANTAGRPSPTTASHVVTDLAGRIDAVLDGGPCRVGVESTVVSLAVSPPRLLRPGGVSLEQLRDVLGDVEVDPALVGELAPGVVPGAPGMKYRHYAPTAPVTIINGSRENAIRWLTSEGESGTAVLCFDEEVSAFSAALPGAVVVPYGPENDPATLARRLFDVLRTLDETPNVTAIYARCPSRDDGLYRAVRNRLFKAAAFTEVDTDDI